MTTSPRVTVTIAPSGAPVLVLPGPDGGERLVQCRWSELRQSIATVLEGQLRAHYAIGLDGAPTQAQVSHWESHGTFADDRCPFCISEGRVSANGHSHSAKPTVIATNGAVVIRRVPASAKGLQRKPKTTVVSAGVSVKLERFGL